MHVCNDGDSHGEGDSTCFADFNNADPKGRVRLNTVGSIRDIEESRIVLMDGVRLELYDDDEIVLEGIVRSDPIEGWVAEVDWGALS